MANAVKNIVAPVVVDYNVVLTLSKNEAETLRSILGKIGGVPSTSRRRFTDSIYKALNDAGVPWINIRTISLENGFFLADEAVSD